MPVSPLPKQSALATGSILPSVICCRSYGITSPAQEVNLTSVISACKGLVLLRLPSIFICTFQKLWLQKFASRLLCEKDREEHIIIQLIILNNFLQHPQISSSFLCPSFPLFIFKELFQSFLFRSPVSSLPSIISDVLTQYDSLSRYDFFLIIVPPLCILMHEHLE